MTRASARTVSAIAAGSPVVRSTMKGDTGGFWSDETYSSGWGTSSRPPCRTSPTTPMTVDHGPLGDGPVRTRCPSGS